MKLSERLELMLHARLTDEQSIIREAMELAKRYEDAPVGFVMGQGLLTESRAAIVSMEDPATVKGQRVRIVLDKER